jgi:AraC-like DNA-binding protein
MVADSRAPGFRRQVEFVPVLTSTTPGVSVRAHTARTLGPWMQGPIDARHDDTLELCVCIAGQMRVRFGAREAVFAAGQLGVIPPGVVHSSWTEDEGASEHVFHVDASEAGGLQAGIWPASPAALAVVAAVGRDAQRACLFALLNELRSEAPLPLVVDPRLARVVAAVRERLDGAWSLKSMAERSAMSVSAFRRAFTDAVGAPPVTWLLEQRLARAAALLRETDRTVTEIAHAVGFGSTSRLSEAFSRRHGVSPSAWRRAQERPSA